MIAHRAANEHGVAGFCARARGRRVGDDPAEAGGNDIYFIRAAAGHYFGVAGDDLHPGFTRGFGHRRDHAAQVGQGQAFFQNESAA